MMSIGSQKRKIEAIWTDDTIAFLCFAQQHAQHQLTWILTIIHHSIDIST